MRNQQPGRPQPWLNQQPGVADMQLRQQQLLYRQMQELQRQQHLQQLDQDARQQNSISSLSAIAKQASSDQLPSLVNGVPIHDASNYMWQGQPIGGDSRIPSSSQMLIAGNANWMHRNGSPAMQGYQNGIMFPQEQNQLFRSMGFVPQQLDQSLYGAPVVTSRDSLNQFPHFQGISNDGVDTMTKASGNQLEKPVAQSATFNAFQSDQSAEFPNQAGISDGVSVSRQGFQGKDLFGHAPVQSLHNGMLSENFQQVNPLSRNVNVQEFHDRQERVGWDGNLQEKTSVQVGSSQGLVSLDPTEAKILFNSDEGIWDNSFGRIGGMNAGGYAPGNQLEGTDFSNVFPSVQSGSWSALMQSAVAETSSSDTGLQDEWSGLSFQKTELSTENHATALNDSGKQPTAWVDNNLQTGSSLTSGPFPLFGDSNLGQSGHGLPGFQQSASHESLHQSPKETNKWINQNPQQKPPIDTTFQVQTPMHMNNSQEGAWGRQIHEQSRISSQSVDMELNSQNMQAAWARQQGMSLYNTGSQSGNKPNGWNINQSLSANEDSTLKILDNEQATQHGQSSESRGDTHMENDHDGRMRSSGDNMVSLSFPNSTGGFEQVRSGASSPQVQHGHQLDYGKHAMFDSSMYRDNENVGKHQHQSGQGLDVRESSLNTSDRASGETYDKKHENYYQKEISDSYISGQAYSRPHTVGDGMRGNAQSVATDARPLFSGNQQSVGQVGRKSSGPRKFQYHPMGNLGVGLEPSDTTKHATHSHPLSQWSTRGFKSQEQGFLGQSKSVGHVVSNSSMDIEKGQLPDLQRNPKGAEEVPSRSVHPGYESAVSTFSAQNKRTIQASQNMLELLHKVDQSREGNTVTDVGSSDHYQSEMPEATAPDRSAAHLHHNRSSGSQGFGLRLAPPSQWPPSSSNHALPSQMSSPIADDLNSRHIDQEGNSGTVIPGMPFPRNQLQQQHISNASGQVADQALHLSFASQADMDAQSKLASHFKQMRDSHDGSEQPQASFPGAAARSLPFNLAAGDACGPIPSALSYSSSAVHSQSINANSSYLRGSGQQSPVSQLPVSSGMSQGGFSSMLQNVWTNVTSQQRLPSGHSSKGPNLFQPMHTSNSLEAASWTSRKADSQGVSRGGNGPSDFGTGSLSSQQFTYGEEQPSKDSSLQQTPHERIKTAAETSGSFQEHVHPHQQDLGRGMPGREQSLISQTEHVSFRNTDSSNNENESFGHSLKSPGDPHQQYSLLHQVQAMKVADTDSSRKSVKRLKGADFGANAQESVAKTGQWFPYGPSSAIRDPVENKLGASSQHMQFPSSDSKMLCFSSEGKEDRNANASHLHVGDAPSNDVPMFGRNDLQNRSSPLGVAPAPSFRGNEHSRINPQMAPSWFERYGTFKNGQILAMHDGVEGSRRDAKMAAQQFFFGKVSEGLQTHTTMEQANAGNAIQAGSIWQSRMDRVPAHEHLSSPHSLPPAVDSSLVLARTKKRKSAGLLPWHKEVTQGSQRLQSLSMAELDWAQATNRLVDKVEDETEMIEDGPSMPRPRRRLILATQLMQQLFRSLPAAILSADAFSEFESVAYCSAKLALGDACSVISCSGSDYCVQPNSSNMISGKAKASERAGDQFFSKLVEDFIGKARKLENDLLRFEYLHYACRTRPYLSFSIYLEFLPLPFVSCQSTKQDILRSSCLKLGSTHIEDQWKSAHLLAESNQSVIIDSTVRRPVLVDVQDVRSDSVVFSFGIAEQCARHEKILQYLMSGSKAEVEGFNFSVLSNLMGLHTVAIDMRQLSTHPTEDEFCLYDIDGNDHHSFLNEKSGFYGPKPLLDFVGDLGRSSMVSVHPDGRVLFTGTGAEVKDLISIVSEFYPSKNPMNCSKQALLVPHFTRNTMDGDAAQVSVMSSSLKLQTVTVAPVKSPEKIKLKPSTKKKQSRKAVRERDLYKKNYFHACESLLSVLVHKRHGKATILSLKKSGPELPQLLTQFSAGIAGTGLAVIFSVICKTIGGRVPFCTTKLLNTGFGLGLVWLSCSVNRLRETIIHISKNSSRAGSNENETIRKVDRSVNEVFLRAAAIMAVAVLRFA